MFIDLTIELTLGFIGLLIAVKIIGKRQVQQVSPFDFISAIVLGELLGNAIYDKETKIFHSLYGIFLWTLLLYIVEKVTQKSRKIRRIIQGSPVLVIKNGLIDYQVLKKEKLDFSELLSLLRDKEVFSIRQVEYAIIEPNGVITVIKKSLYDNVIKSDLNIVSQPTPLNLPLIVDGEVDTNNLKATDYDESWLIQSLKEQEVQNVDEVLYAEWNSVEGLYIQRVTDRLPSAG
ncbi:DUF421 domain-containing protein [Petroclostridium sp. X23]|uniref:DUF421 domain-containing protein n=1 Tax=Petroclostridium sp. X23 TaxID=3045146 RepID=UPI0024AE41C2|nr:DUF421 domain-containing protein [Petroclostridium sp. X23]WHH60059.1 DUF421 domain-containing protein [Petroclostridium sp. X23]